MFGKAAILALAALPFSLAQISDDFESGWDQTKWPIYAQDCNQGGTVALDTSTAHSGSNSIKVTSPGGYCGHIFFGSTAIPTGDLYVRVWLKATNALTASHVSFITMTDETQGTGKHLRIGGQDSILMWNRESSDATLPDLSPDGVASSVALPAGSWECFEYHIGSDGSVATWLNSEAITGLTTPNNFDSGWTSSAEVPKISGVYFGWESYGGDTNTFWYDDVSIGSTRVGCAGGGGSTTTAKPTTTGPTTTGGSTTVPTTSAPSTTTAPTTMSTSTTAASTTSSAAAGSVPLYGQCGGIGYAGPTACASGTCTSYGAYYSQCVPSA